MSSLPELQNEVALAWLDSPEARGRWLRLFVFALFTEDFSMNGALLIGDPPGSNDPTSIPLPTSVGTALDQLRAGYAAAGQPIEHLFLTIDGPDGRYRFELGREKISFREGEAALKQRARDALPPPRAPLPPAPPWPGHLAVARVYESAAAQALAESRSNIARALRALARAEAARQSPKTLAAHPTTSAQLNAALAFEQERVDLFRHMAAKSSLPSELRQRAEAARMAAELAAGLLEDAASLHAAGKDLPYAGAFRVCTACGAVSTERAPVECAWCRAPAERAVLVT